MEMEVTVKDGVTRVVGRDQFQARLCVLACAVSAVTTCFPKVTNLDATSSLADDDNLSPALHDKDIWVATAARPSHGIHESHKEGKLNEQARASH